MQPEVSVRSHKSSGFSRASESRHAAPRRPEAHQPPAHYRGCAPQKAVLHKRLCSAQGCAPHKAVLHTRLCSTQGCAPHKAVLHTRLCSTQGCAPHQGSGRDRILVGSRQDFWSPEILSRGKDIWRFREKNPVATPAAKKQSCRDPTAGRPCGKSCRDPGRPGRQKNPAGLLAGAPTRDRIFGRPRRPQIPSRLGAPAEKPVHCSSWPEVTGSGLSFT